MYVKSMRETAILGTNSTSTHCESGSVTPGATLGENGAVNGDSMEYLLSLWHAMLRTSMSYIVAFRLCTGVLNNWGGGASGPGKFDNNNNNKLYYSVDKFRCLIALIII